MAREGALCLLLFWAAITIATFLEVDQSVQLELATMSPFFPSARFIRVDVATCEDQGPEIPCSGLFDCSLEMCKAFTNNTHIRLRTPFRFCNDETGINKIRISSWIFGSSIAQLYWTSGAFLWLFYAFSAIYGGFLVITLLLSFPPLQAGTVPIVVLVISAPFYLLQMLFYLGWIFSLIHFNATLSNTLNHAWTCFDAPVRAFVIFQAFSQIVIQIFVWIMFCATVKPPNE